MKDDNGKPLTRSQEIMRLAFREQEERFEKKRGEWAPVWEAALKAAQDFTSTRVGDAVSHPSHYTSHPSGIEAIELTRHHDFLTGNVLKYVLRAPYKGSEVQDLKKAAQYLTWAIEKAESKESK
ncbi:DUF3310 domain-containing protein [Streptomyces sp. NPDC004111]|uniref:DUF3310 domain-containing protein n=1 Tax=Streptomyces sp. NPDC004111 TaxID=3364690 RepID=UPI0036ABEBBC